MDIQRNQMVEAIAGDHKGEKGRVIRRPMGSEGITMVSRDNGRTFQVKAAELVVIGEEKVQG